MLDPNRKPTQTPIDFKPVPPSKAGSSQGFSNLRQFSVQKPISQGAKIKGLIARFFEKGQQDVTIPIILKFIQRLVPKAKEIEVRLAVKGLVTEKKLKYTGPSDGSATKVSAIQEEKES
jgi:hypothetical protein